MASILVVDDNADKIARIISVLESAGASRDQIEIAQTGVEARRCMSSARYELLVLDIALPFRAEDRPDRQGGITLLKELREQSIFKLPGSVVGLTGYDDLHSSFGDIFASQLWTLDYFCQTDSGWSERLAAKTKYVLARASQTDRPKYSTDLCVLTALHSPEFRALRGLSWNWNVPSSLDEINYVYRGHFDTPQKRRSVVAGTAPRMGMVAATIMTAKLIAAFRPRMLVMVGICAGVPGECQLGDVLVADPTWDWQMGKYISGTFAMAPDQIGVPTAIGERFRQLGADGSLWLDVHSSFSGPKPANLPALKVGPVASGSAVLADATLLETIKSQNRKMVGLDMELYGMYAAARDASPPNPITFGLKSVCDFADHQKNDAVQHYAAYTSVRTLEAFCERYCDELLKDF